MDSFKVILVDGKVRLFIDGEEITWEKSLLNNSITESENTEKIRSLDDAPSAQQEIAIDEVKHIDGVSSHDSTQEDLASGGTNVNKIDAQENVYSETQEVPSDLTIDKIDSQDNVSSGDILKENLASEDLAIDGLENEEDTSSNTGIHDEIKILQSKNINSNLDEKIKESGMKLNDLIKSNVHVDIIESQKDNFINENVNPDKNENIIDKNLKDDKVEKNNDKNIKDIKPIEIPRRKVSSGKKRKNRKKQIKQAEESKLLETKTSIPIVETEMSEMVHMKQPRKCLQSIIKALSGERKVLGPTPIQTFSREDCEEACSLPIETPLVVKIEKIGELPSITKQDAIKLLRTNLNESNIFIEKVVNVLGVSKSLEIYDQTRMVQEFGGLDVKNGSRKRTPGGVFITLMRDDKSIKPEQIDEILNQGTTNWKKEDAKQRHAKTNAELKEKLEQGGWL